jgi:hypothetical protein
VLALLFVVLLPAVTARLYSSDEVQYFSYLRSLYFDHDVSFENEYRHFYDAKIAQSPGFHETFLERETAAGRRVNYGTVGSAILWMPFYAVADAWVRLTGTAEANGFTQPYINAVAYGSAFYGFLAILLSIRAARVILEPTGQRHDTHPASRTALTGVAVWLGTPLLFYMYVAPPFSHACSAFAVAFLVNVWLHVRKAWTVGGAVALGLTAALVAMVREQDAFVALGPALDFAWSFKSTVIDRDAAAVRRGAALSPRVLTVAAIAGVTGFVLGYAAQLLAYNALNGYPGPAEHVSRKMYWYAPHALQVLASPQHGFLIWTPLAALALAGLFTLKDRRIAICLLVMAASQVYVAGSVESWTVAGAFGQRRFVCLTAVLVIGLAGLWNSVTGPDTRRAATPSAYLIPAIVVVCVWWNVALMAQFATRLMDRQRLEPARNAYHAFVTLPLRAPALAYRYLTDRRSFYESDPGGAHR